MGRRKNSPTPSDENSGEGAEPAADPGSESTSAGRSRRDFLRLGGLTAAGAVVGGAGGAAAGYALGQRSGFDEAMNDYGELAPRHAPGFDHVVVVMGELAPRHAPASTTSWW